jgi:hypothetical protein
LRWDPNLLYAQEGKARAENRIRIAKRIRFFLTDPERMTADEQLQNALALAEEARQIATPSPRLAAELQQLEEMITVVTTPVTVRLVSDGQTEVAVYKIGRLGRFQSREIQLRPGTYTVVGQRDGYQDERRQIKVAPEADGSPVTIACSVQVNPE